MINKLISWNRINSPAFDKLTVGNKTKDDKECNENNCAASAAFKSNIYRWHET